MLSGDPRIVEKRKAFALYDIAAEFVPVSCDLSLVLLFLIIYNVTGMGAAFGERVSQSFGAGAQFVQKPGICGNHVSFKPALFLCICGKTESILHQNCIEEFKVFVFIASACSETDYVVHIEELEQLIGIDAYGAYAHSASHYRNGFPLVFTGEAVHVPY